MRVLFWGTPLFAIPSLDALHSSPDHTIVAVVSQPDKPSGRGMKTSASPVKQRAVALSLPILQPKSTKDELFLEMIRSLAPDLSVVAAYGKILHRNALEVPRAGSVCLHPSLLPRYRGAAPIPRAIMDGATETGVTLFQMDEGLDTGPLILQRPLPIRGDDTLDSLEEKLSLVSAKFLMEGLTLISRGEAKLVPQEGEATFAPKLAKEEAWIDWSEEALPIERKIRAMDSRPGATTLLHGKVLKVYRARLLTEDAAAAPGTVVRLLPDAIVVAAGSGAIALTEIQLEGKKRMDASSFLRGKKLEVGTQLG
jgi:methionyl-tRNA formyltransferase